MCCSRRARHSPPSWRVTAHCEWFPFCFLPGVAEVAFVEDVVLVQEEVVVVGHAHLSDCAVVDVAVVVEAVVVAI